MGLNANHRCSLKRFSYVLKMRSFHSIEFSTTNLLNKEYNPSVLQQRNAMEQAANDDEKRSINALTLFISMFLTAFICINLSATIRFLI